MNTQLSPTGHPRRRWWLRRAASLGFWLFLIKGMLWLVIPALMAMGWIAPVR